jgi:DNA-directed RNA polymerase specialized sigma24 family protein
MPTITTHDRGSDERLMVRFSQRETAAAEELYDRFGPRVFGIGLGTLHAADLAADLIERTFVRMWHRGHHFLSGSAALDDWVLAQAVGVALQMSGRQAAAGRGARIQEEGRDDAAIRA